MESMRKKEQWKDEVYEYPVFADIQNIHAKRKATTQKVKLALDSSGGTLFLQNADFQCYRRNKQERCLRSALANRIWISEWWVE